ncbi:MAG TPA: ActS/PrrB/RegB family redox-sensitive histidine kinase [Alphaproteobacteria bacterium]|nr:ActS/PrrB/RegB family redox-sensitive histidine kinase [Alphaproteobacteria bacterium]
MTMSPTAKIGAGPRPAPRRRVAWLPPHGRVSLRTLSLIRWLAIAGQLAAVLGVHYGLGFALPLEPCLMVIGASALVNLVASVRRIGRPRLEDSEATIYLAFDILQLAAMLYLTGGLQNPFAILILAPVTVAATTLSAISVAGLVILALTCIAILAVAHHPLPWGANGLALPQLYLTGVWTALTVACAFAAGYVWRVAAESRRLSEALAASQLALAREQKMSALGALAAAVAHELGTPLGTITVVTKELARDIPPDSPYAEDMQLLLSETRRCREILAELSRRPEADGGDPYEQMPLQAVIDEAAAAYRRPEVEMPVSLQSEDGSPAPVMKRSPEILHGLGTLIQNAHQYAERMVKVNAQWNRERLSISIVDDGPGYPPHFLSRLGEPYLSTRAGMGPGGEHMGLGIFIAQTLLNHTGADLDFANDRDGGAVVVVTWQRAMLTPEGDSDADARR